MTYYMLNQPLRYTQYCFRHDSIQKKFILERGLYTLLLGRNSNSPISRHTRPSARSSSWCCECGGPSRSHGSWKNIQRINELGFRYYNAHQRNSLWGQTLVEATNLYPHSLSYQDTSLTKLPFKAMPALASKMLDLRLRKPSQNSLRRNL